MMKFTKEWAISALIRAIRTFAQTALAMFTIGQRFAEIDWLGILSVAGVAAVYSILTSVVTGLPESQATDGTLQIDPNGETEKWLFTLDTPIDEVSGKNNIRLAVKTKHE